MSRGSDLCCDCYGVFPEGTLQRFEGDFVCDPCINERERLHEAKPEPDNRGPERGEWRHEAVKAMRLK